MTISFKGLLQRRRWPLLALLVVAVSSFAWVGYRYWHRPLAYKGTSRIEVDMHKPEMLLVTRNLAELPKDVAAAPALRGLVDEALVFQYEEDEARLSLEGSLRRLAYEHDIALQDRFLATLLSAPAEIAIWRSSKGRPEYFAAAMERGALAKLTEVLAKVALNDGQLALAGTFSVGSHRLPFYTLAYGGGRSMGFIGSGDHWVFLSDPALALDADNALTSDAQEVLGALLDGKHPWQEALPPATDAKHSLVVGAEALTLGYASFVPALQALRLDYSGNAWHPAVRVDGKALPEQYDLRAKLTSIWRSVPANAALCFAIPVDWKAAASPLGELLQGVVDPQSTLAALDPLGAVCWYADSRLSAPLFVAQATQAPRPGASRVLAALATKVWKVAGEVQPQAYGGDKELYATTVASQHGIRMGNGAERSFWPALARHGELFLFSPDQRRVEAALAVADKQAPAVGDLASLQSPAWMLYDPKRLAQLVKAEVQEVLPADEESFFREVARTRLWPRLDAWGQQQSLTTLVPGNTPNKGFYALEVKALGARGAAVQQ